MNRLTAENLRIASQIASERKKSKLFQMAVDELKSRPAWSFAKDDLSMVNEDPNNQNSELSKLNLAIPGAMQNSAKKRNKGPVLVKSKKGSRSQRTIQPVSSRHKDFQQRVEMSS